MIASASDDAASERTTPCLSSGIGMFSASCTARATVDLPLPFSPMMKFVACPSSISRML